MDVRCEKCLTEYDFDDAQVPEAGVTVKCTTCGFVFKVKKRLAPPAPARSDEFAPDASHIDKPREWKIRQPSGNVFTCRELTTLQKWIVEQKVARQDEISLTGDQWKRLGDIPELAGFFLVVDQALRGRALEQQLGHDATLASPPRARTLEGPTQLRGRPAADPGFGDVDSDEDADLRAIRKKGPGMWLGGLLVLGAAGVGAWLFLRSQTPPGPAKVAPEPGASGSSSGSSSGSGSGSGSTGAAVPLAAGVSSGSGSGSGSSSGSASGSSTGSSGSSGSSTGSSGSGGSSAGPSGSSGTATGRPLAASVPDAGGAAEPRKVRRGGGGGAPSGVEGLSARGLKLIDQERYDEAVEMFQKALAISPSYGEAEMGMAEALRQSGKKAQAISMYKKFLEDHPDADDAPAARGALKALSE